jgi:hypothetical protein
MFILKIDIHPDASIHRQVTIRTHPDQEVITKIRVIPKTKQLIPRQQQIINPSRTKLHQVPRILQLIQTITQRHTQLKLN